MARVFLGLGSNEGDRLQQLSRAIHRLGQVAGVRVIQVAPIYETTPVGPPQPDYLNTVIEIDTSHPPHELFRLMKQLERDLGRLPSTQRWGPRPIDLDLLLYDDAILQAPELTIPHAQLHARRFVLEPLSQLAPTVVHPVLHQTIAELLANLPIDNPLTNCRVSSDECRVRPSPGPSPHRGEGTGVGHSSLPSWWVVG